MIAVIPSAGRGGRLSPITATLPKVMVEIAGKPLLAYHVENLKKIGVDTFCINLHYLPKIITGYFGDGKKFGVKIYYFFEKELLGTAGLLNNFRKILKRRFWFVAGDAFLPNFDFGKMELFHNKKKALITIALRKRPDRIDTDFAEIDKDFKITKVYVRPHKVRPKTNFDTCMVYLVEPEIFQYLPRNGYLDFSQQLLPKLIAKNLPVFGYITDEFIEDVGTAARYRKVKNIFES